MSTRTVKWGVATLSAAAALGLGWALMPDRVTQRSTVEMIDIGEELEALLGGREVLGAQGDPNTFELRDLPEDVLRTLSPPIESKGREFDPVAGFRRSPHVEKTLQFPEHHAGGWTLHTNERGFRGTDPVRASAPDLRVLVGGDSHTDGVCADDETFSHLLEEALIGRGIDAEVVNSGVGGYTFVNYLGSLQANLDLKPDVFLLVVYGGNDFSGLMSYERYFYGRPAPVRTGPELRAFRGESGPPGIIPQDLSQALYFARNPEDVERSIAMANALTDHMARVCRENGIAFACAYLPPASQVQGELYSELYVGALRLIDLSLEDIRVTDRLAEGWLDHLRRREIPFVDLREALDVPEHAYWFVDFHINVRAHQLVAKALLPLIDS